MKNQHVKDDLINWKERYENLLNSLNIGFVLVDMNENFLEVNQTLLRMAGISREQIIGKNNSDFYNESEFEKMREIGIPLQKEGNYQFEFFIPTTTGQKIPVLFNTSVNKDKNGNPESLNVMITDISEQKKFQEELKSMNQALTVSLDKLEKEKKKIEVILFGIGDCVTIFDSDGNLILSNPKGMQIRRERKAPPFPLKAGIERELTLKIGGEQLQFIGRVEAICDNHGNPFAYVEILKDVTNEIRLEQREQELFQVRRELKRRDLHSKNAEMIGVSGAMRNVFDLILRCAEVDSTVLILGETGVGKELAARAIYSQSDRKDKPFVAVDCGSLPETLLESELFGHVKGAFTGATSERQGLFREAQGGTLFFDEVGNLSDSMQAKLLRAIQEREIRPLGGSRTYNVDVRIITATNRNLQELVNRDLFRHDLYYRIAVIPLTIPPLREREEDILHLAKHFMKKHRKINRKSPRSLNHAAQKFLIEYKWPGNVRELENAIEHAMAMSQGALITQDDLPVQIVILEEPWSGENFRSNQSLITQVADKALITEALNRHNGNRTKAAKDLGISRTTIWRKITMYNLK